MPAAVLGSVPFGAFYAWSVMNGPMTRLLGVVAPAAGDWNLSDVLPIFTINGMTFGLSMALFGGRAVERYGPRRSMLAGAALWSTGLAVGGLGVSEHSLVAVLGGYGFLGGLGVCLGYLAPMTLLQRWFPDQRGFAAGVSVAGFGGGTIVAAPYTMKLMQHFEIEPTFVGSVAETEVTVVGGRRVAEFLGESVEVVLATSGDLAAAGFDTLAPGFYAVGSGDSGAAATLFALAATNAAVATVASFGYRLPHAKWAPPPPLHVAEEGGNDAATTAPASAKTSATMSVDANAAMMTPQFVLTTTMVFGYACGGFILIPVGKTLIGDVFASNPLVTAEATTLYVSALSLANMSGRIGYGVISDKLGPQRTLAAFGLLGIPACLAIPSIIDLGSSSATGSAVPVAAFVTSTLFLVSMFGGTFSVLAPRNVELFGPRDFTITQGRFLLGSTAAVIVGPRIVANLRASSERSAIDDLVQQLEPSQFEIAFDAPLAQLDALIEGKTVTINSLLTQLPHSVDPTPTLYNSTMVCAAGFYSLGLAALLLTRPVSRELFTPDTPRE